MRSTDGRKLGFCGTLCTATSSRLEASPILHVDSDQEGDRPPFLSSLDLVSVDFLSLGWISSFRMGPSKRPRDVHKKSVGPPSSTKRPKRMTLREKVLLLLERRQRDGNIIDVSEQVRWHGPGVKVKVNVGSPGETEIFIPHYADYRRLASDLYMRIMTWECKTRGLLHSKSEFSVLFMDREGKWRSVSNVPWRDFVDSVVELRIVRNDKVSSDKPAMMTCT